VGTAGLDLTGARLHPFFEVDENEAIGTIKWLQLDEDLRLDRQPRNLVCDPGGRLFWLDGESASTRKIEPNGARYAIHYQHDTRIHGIAGDPLGRLWYVGDTTIGAIPMSTISHQVKTDSGEFSAWKHDLKDAPHSLATDPAGSLWVSTPTETVRVTLLPSTFEFHSQRLPLLDPSSRLNRVTPAPEGERLIFTAADRDQLHVESTRKGMEPFDGSFQGRNPQGLAWEPDGKAWFTLAGKGGEALAWLDSAGNSRVLPFKDGPPLEPQGIAAAPDGAMWFTLKAGRAIMRRSPDGTPKPYFLPAGIRPLEIVAGRDGRMFFTVEGQAVIGSIRVEKRPSTRAAAAPGDAKADAGWEEGLDFRPRPVRASKYPSREARRKAGDERMARAELRAQERLEIEGEDTGLEPEEAGPEAAEAALEGKATGAAGENPLELLLDLDINLAPRSTRHILHRHGPVRRRNTGQFHRDFQNREGLQALIARGLKDRGGVDLGRSESFGRNLTLCAADRPVGWYHHFGVRKQTRAFLVVTERIDGVDGAEHDIRTAYPVSETGRHAREDKGGGAGSGCPDLHQGPGTGPEPPGSPHRRDVSGRLGPVRPDPG
jgi:streptogramin lyase